jgi:hypothetical protein
MTMKNKFYALFIAGQMICVAARAQLYVQNGATLATTGNAIVTLQNVDLQNNGTISQAATGKFVFNGTANNNISGSNSTAFDTLEIAKTGAAKLSLAQNAVVNSAVLFTAGLIDLNNQNMILQPGAILKNETEAAHITGISGGNVAISAPSPNNPVGYNLGNLGASISTTQSMGVLQILRSHQPKANPGNAAATSIQRSFVIMPDNNTGLNATLRFYYLDAELNGKNENTLTLWRSTDGIHWNLAGVDNRNTLVNYVEKNSIASFSTWTLTDAATVLPVTLVSYAAICKSNITTIKWTTGTEEAGGRFEIERSTDAAATFVTTGNRIAVGSGGNTYEFTDVVASGHSSFYRIKLIAADGNYIYSPVFSGGCSDITMPFSIYPNPAHEGTAVHIAVRQSTKAAVTVYNAAGQMIMQVSCNLGAGNNTIPLATDKLAAGSYFVQMLFDNGTLMKGSFIKL